MSQPNSQAAQTQPSVSRKGRTTVTYPFTPPMAVDSEGKIMYLELKDGTTYQGQSFGADESVAGELVFQTGLVGYPESLTDPSYRGQILVITFPLVGNYGVPSREEMDSSITNMPAYFEANEIHVAGIIVASYSGEDFSHFLAVSSLGTWLKEQGIPAMQGVDTRALTKRIRQEGTMLGKLLIENKSKSNGIVEPGTKLGGIQDRPTLPAWRNNVKAVDWFNPNIRNMVADGR